jgi:hypothetical protein
MVTSVSSISRPDKIISLQDVHFTDRDGAVGPADGHRLDERGLDGDAAVQPLLLSPPQSGDRSG